MRLYASRMESDDEPLLDDPFATFEEWGGDADACAYEALSVPEET